MNRRVPALVFVLMGILTGMAAGGFLALDYGISVGRSSGLAIGSQAGICIAADTAATDGLLRDEQAVDTLIAAAGAKIREQQQALPADSGFSDIRTRERCDAFVQTLVEDPSTPAPSPAAPAAR
jgi:hypothetical protein